MNTGFPLIEVAGPPRERGHQYGRLAGEQIAHGIGMYKREFEKRALAWSSAVDLADQFTNRIAAYDPAFMVEIEGIAAGADQPTGAIVVLNARTEILYWNALRSGRPLAAADVPTAEGCTGIIVAPAASATRDLIHAQNWDWRAECRHNAVVLKIIGDEHPDILTFVEAGQLARNGLNSAGIALTANGLHCDQDYGRLGVPNPLIRRRVLQQRVLARALEVVMNAERSFSHNLMLSDASGLAVDLETTPDDVFWLQPEGGLLLHANHFKSPAALARVRDVGVVRGPDTLIRDQRVAALLQPRIGQITAADVRMALADDVGGPLGVCRRPVDTIDDGFSCTVATIIMSPQQRTMWVAAAPYEGARYAEYSLARAES